MLNLIGEKFGRLTVVEHVGSLRGHKLYKCICQCGVEKEITSSDLKSGRVKSCGCLRKEITTSRNKTHDLRNHRLYRIWANMKSRCFNPNSSRYNRYGGRNISVCKEWRNDFKTFYDWAVCNGYDDSLSIDRIDNNGNYEPDNCRWETNKAQSRNKSSNKTIVLNCERKTLIEWSETYNINVKTIQDRLKRGWSIQDAITTPSEHKYASR